MFPALDTHDGWATTLPFPTERALRESIRHWRANTFGAFEGRGPFDCALCRLYLQEMCKGCPVFAFTGNPGCVGTPYSRSASPKRVVHADSTFGMSDLRSASQEELDFLEMLLGLAHASDAERGAAYCAA